MSLISVLIPVYNHADTIKKSLDSLMKQTHRSIEVVLVDDGSVDNFKSVIEEWVQKSRDFVLNTKSVHQVSSELAESSQNNKLDIKIIYQENKGAPSARNRAFVESIGEFVIFWDADTIANPQMLEKMLCTLQKHPEASYVYSQFKFGWKVFKSSEFDIDKLKENNFIDTTSLIRRDDFVGFDEALKRFQDWDMWLTMFEKNKVGVFIKEVLYTKIVQGRIGISNWLPGFIYKLPWKSGLVKKYDLAKDVIIKKHHLK